MKILILSRGIPSEKDPQEGCFEFDQAKALKELGHEVIVMAIDSRIRKFWRTPGIKKSIIDGILTYRLFTFPSSIIRHLISFRLGINFEALEATLLYKYLLKKEGPFDLIHAHFLPCIFYAYKIKKKFDIPVIGTEHWSKVDSDTRAHDVQYMGKKAYANIDYLISVSSSLREKIKNNFGVESIVIHNLIDLSFLKPIPENKTNNTFTIILVGSLITRKGFDFFIKSFKNSQLASQNISVVIIGGGPERQHLEDLINQLSLRDKVKLVGQRSKKYIFDKLNSADLFVLPSRSENFSVSVLEALANGLPVLATICGGIKECINHSNGVLVEVDNEGDMVNALENMFENYRHYDRNTIQEGCLNLYSPTNIAKQISNVYYSVLKKEKHV